jgi:hypothetical protein
LGDKALPCSFGIASGEVVAAWHMLINGELCTHVGARLDERSFALVHESGCAVLVRASRELD